ncbi:putative ABC transporter ATP-binding protein [Jeotgalicoccus saudimassiliensis]|uniref:Putative ABC transporter ATP-binding protein n=1 Tax=Jeotgalicoccus saudimassiliensis TaxID=1461582 RepID=A0A078M0P8_9STAP|nr:ATP-binding cassette domain-containing protein [Jeotgalicoccus saudimassiliensis]CDZ98977.1 putative ABC transporter ATP-binding protein [Jeotgalicoccus saudimassiliensis]
MMYLKGERMHIFYSIVLGIIGGLVGVAIFGLSGYMISLSFFEPPFFLIILIIAMIKMFGLTKGTAKYMERLLSHDATFKMIGRLRAAYFKQSVNSAEDTHSVRYIQKLTSYFDDIEDYYIRIIYPYIVAVFISLILTVLSLLIDPKLLFILLVSVLVMLVVMPTVISSISGRFYDDRNRAEDTLFTQLYHYIHDFTNLFAVKEDKQVNRNIKRTYKKITDNENKEAVLDAVIDIVSLLIQLGVIILVIILFSGDYPLLIPMIILLLMSFFELAVPVIKPASRYKAVKARVEAVSDTERAAESAKQTALSLTDMTFRYPSTKRDVLTNINIDIKPGEKHALIGGSGSGKTTLLNQLIKQSDAGIMPQHLDFYNATVQENITMFNHFESEESEMRALLEQFELEHFKPDDYITSAEYLSLGEKKRMHLIRMYIENRSTWILDEPTASLNTRLRDKIWNEIFQKETVIAATHDLSQLEQFDYVHYLENGTLTESKKVTEALASDGPVSEAYKRYHDAL